MNKLTFFGNNVIARMFICDLMPGDTIYFYNPTRNAIEKKKIRSINKDMDGHPAFYDSSNNLISVVSNEDTYNSEGGLVVPPSMGTFFYSVYTSLQAAQKAFPNVPVKI